MMGMDIFSKRSYKVIDGEEVVEISPWPEVEEVYGQLRSRLRCYSKHDFATWEYYQIEQYGDTGFTKERLLGGNPEFISTELFGGAQAKEKYGQCLPVPDDSLLLWEQRN